MYLMLQLLGSDDEGDPWHVDLQSYSMHSDDKAERWAIVLPPYRDRPPEVPPSNSPLWDTSRGFPVLIGLEPSQLTAWHARLAARYPNPPYPVRTPQFF